MMLRLAPQTLIFALFGLHAALAATQSDQPTAVFSHATFLLVVPILLLAQATEESRMAGTASPTSSLAWVALMFSQSMRARTILLAGTTEDVPFALEAAAWLCVITFTTVHFMTPPRPNAYMAVGGDVDNRRPPASMYSILTFGYMTDLMRAGVERPVSRKDLWELRPDLDASMLIAKFQRSYRPRYDSQSLWPFFRAVLPFLGIEYFIALGLLFVSVTIDLIQPQLLKQILAFINAGTDDPDFPTSYGWTVVALMALLAVVAPPIKEQWFHMMLCFALKIRTGLLGAVYSKSLRLSSSARQKYSQGQIQTLQSVDTEAVQALGRQSLVGVRGPIQLALVFYFLYRELGWAFVPGFLILLCSMPVQVALTEKAGVREKSRLEAMDKRIKWVIKNLRLLELENIRISLLYQAFAATVLQVQPQLIAIACFGTFVLISKDPLTPSRAFVSLSLLRLMSGPLNWIRGLFIASKKISISARRMNDFLRAEEVDRTGTRHRRFSAEEGDGSAVVIKEAAFYWSKEDAEEAPAVEIEDMTVKNGELVAIVGRTGQGKTSLLSAMLGEMFLRKGSASIYGTVAYASQQAWIISGSIRDNIVFGGKWDPMKYAMILESCALNKDLDLFPAGDMTEIGERGINLSGGQKARVAIARAVYADADIYLFDDVLSAVDMHVDSHIFKQVLGETGILRDKTRIFVTNGIHHLPAVDTVLFVKAGAIHERGDFRQLVEERGEFASMVEIMMADDEKMRGHNAAKVNAAVGELVVGSVDAKVDVRDLPPTYTQGLAVLKPPAPSGNVTPMPQPSAPLTQATGALTSEEDQGVGSAGFGAYKQYAMAFSLRGFAICFALAVASSAFSAASSWWLGEWSSAGEEGQTVRIWFYFGVYVGIIVFYAITGTLVTYLFRAVFALRAATVLHDHILNAIMKAPMSFFNTTPTGRILNRFSKDIETVCDDLPISFLDTLTEGIFVVSGIVVCTIATPLYIIVVLPLLYPYLWLQKYYLGASRDLRRLQATTRSPIYQILGESLDGLPTIRAYGAEEQFIGYLKSRVNLNNNAWETQLSSNRWFDVRIDTVGLLAMVISAALCVASRGKIEPAMAGLAITYAAATAGYLSFSVQDFCLLEVNIVAVERINQYVDCPQEAPSKVSPPPRVEWPEEGRLEFQGYSTRYREGLDLVIKDLTVTVQPKERIGIVGRTGSGKSSLILGLTRIIEPASGSILLDGVDLRSLGLDDVRKNITVIPQEPVLFATSLRENLDPFYEHTDEEVWRSLERSHMKDWASSLPLKLDTPVTEGGGNLSVGERQLLCMAKAVLRRSRVLVLDEVIQVMSEKCSSWYFVKATSSIDIRTDELIQRMLREEFPTSTVLCIAHRINTILDYDRILVMDEGRAMEFETPASLLARPDTLFAKLCRQYQDNVAGLS
ncbi:Multidrug resistance-associated protein 1 [Irineochytrium annulatum]|nr:Multidrug resistance-associated protein 1 [Irineochytrium annulatum]